MIFFLVLVVFFHPINYLSVTKERYVSLHYIKIKAQNLLKMYMYKLNHFNLSESVTKQEMSSIDLLGCIYNIWFQASSKTN